MDGTPCFHTPHGKYFKDAPMLCDGSHGKNGIEEPPFYRWETVFGIRMSLCVSKGISDQTKAPSLLGLFFLASYSSAMVLSESSRIARKHQEM